VHLVNLCPPQSGNRPALVGLLTSEPPTSQPSHRTRRQWQ